MIPTHDQVFHPLKSTTLGKPRGSTSPYQLTLGQWRSYSGRIKRHCTRAGFPPKSELWYTSKGFEKSALRSWVGVQTFSWYGSARFCNISYTQVQTEESKVPQSLGLYGTKQVSSCEDKLGSTALRPVRSNYELWWIEKMAKKIRRDRRMKKREKEVQL